jgi:hypothetical protein
MIFIMVSTDPSVQAVTRVKVPGRHYEDHPCLAFATASIGQFFQKIRNIDGEQNHIICISDAPTNAKIPSDLLVFTSEQQILDSLGDPEGFDYESLIQQSDFNAHYQ